MSLPGHATGHATENRLCKRYHWGTRLRQMRRKWLLGIRRDKSKLDGFVGKWPQFQMVQIIDAAAKYVKFGGKDDYITPDHPQDGEVVSGKFGRVFVSTYYQGIMAKGRSENTDWHSEQFILNHMPDIINKNDDPSKQALLIISINSPCSVCEATKRIKRMCGITQNKAKNIPKFGKCIYLYGKVWKSTNPSKLQWDHRLRSAGITVASCTLPYDEDTKKGYHKRKSFDRYNRNYHQNVHVPVHTKSYDKSMHGTYTHMIRPPPLKSHPIRPPPLQSRAKSVDQKSLIKTVDLKKLISSPQPNGHKSNSLSKSKKRKLRNKKRKSVNNLTPNAMSEYTNMLFDASYDAYDGLYDSYNGLGVAYSGGSVGVEYSEAAVGLTLFAVLLGFLLFICIIICSCAYGVMFGSAVMSKGIGKSAKTKSKSKECLINM